MLKQILADPKHFHVKVEETITSIKILKHPSVAIGSSSATEHFFSVPKTHHVF